MHIQLIFHTVVESFVYEHKNEDLNRDEERDDYLADDEREKITW